MERKIKVIIMFLAIFIIVPITAIGYILYTVTILTRALAFLMMRKKARAKEELRKFQKDLNINVNFK